jgi:hypothetical protein
MTVMRKIIKYIFLLLVTLPIFILLLALFLARFTNFSWTMDRKTFIGYNESTKEWVFNDWEIYPLKSPDGPYVFCNSEDNCTIVRVEETSSGFNLTKELRSRNSIDSLKVDLPDGESIKIKLKKHYSHQPFSYPEADSLIAISDIEGNFQAFSDLLQASGIVDEKFNWTFGNGHLVLNGDFVDRGEYVTEVLWLIYKLEQEANLNGGKVHFILGNHELMNIKGKARYLNEKYKAFAQKYSLEKNYKKAFKTIMTDENEIVKWLKSKNVIVKIGDNIFTHGGLSHSFVQEFLPSINQINATFHQYINNQALSDSSFARALVGRLGPLWYRGNVKDYKEYYQKESESKITSSLDHFEAKRLFIGHTVVDTISSDYNQKVIRLDVKHGKSKSREKPQCIKMIGKQIWVVFGDGSKNIIN